MLKNLFKQNTSSRNLTDYIRQIVVISTILITVGVASIISIQEFLLFQRISEQQREDHIRKQKEFIKDLIAIEVDYISNQRELFDERIADELEENVCYAYNIAQQIYSTYQGKLPVAEIKKMIITSISAFKCSSPFAQVFINQLDGTGVYYLGNSGFEGKNLIDHKDVHGNYVVRNEIELLKKDGSGLIKYGTGELVAHRQFPQNKVTYVKVFEPFQWYFGSKCYLDDYYDDFKMEIAKKISSERFRYGGYVFLNESDGDPIVLNGKVYKGDFNFYDGSDTEKMDVFKKEVTAALSAKEGDYFTYEWNKIGEVTKSKKISFARQFADCGWIVGAGFYEDEVDVELTVQKEQLKKGLYRNLYQIFLMLFIVLLIEGYIIYRFNKNYQADFLHFSSFFKIGKGEYRKIEVDKLHFNEFRNMGIVANEMIEERVKVHSQLVEEQKRAQESDRLKTAFLANMSHEIRTPMNAIIGFSELINDDGLAERDKKMFVNLILQNGEFLMSLINDIIDIAKIESDQLNIVKRKFKLDDLLENIRVHYQENISNNPELKIKFELEKDLPVNFLCNSDEFRLKQVLDNLIGNAIKFTTHGLVKLTVSKKKDRVRFSVSDTGIGISAEELDSIFERFIQAKNHTKRNYGGTGLGLAISQNIVQLLGGKIGVRSQQGKGSEFYFDIKN